MQRRITQLVGSLAFSVFTSVFVVSALFASPVGAATGPDALGNGGATSHAVSKTHPATGAIFSANISGTHYVYVNNGSSPNSVKVWYDKADLQLICSEQGSNTFGLFHVISGSYSLLAHMNGTGNNPTAMAQVNHYLIVTNDGSASISVYRLLPGSMTFTATIPLPVTGNPNGIAAF